MKKNQKKFNIKLAKKRIIGINDKEYPILMNNISYVYNKKTPYEYKALNNVTTKIKPKIITAIIGSTGSGKTTLIQHINGLLIPNDGTIKINDFEINKKTKKIKNVKSLRKSIGLVFQFPEYQLFEDTVEKDIMFGSLNMGVPKNEAIKLAKKFLDIVGLDNKYLNKSPFNLSGGQKRRVAIAGILSLEGNTLILDEPTAGLDPQGEKDFINLFKKINNENNTRIIVISHDMDAILELADEVIVMKNGNIISFGTPFEIFQNSDLIREAEIKVPKLYRIINKLNQNGFNFTNKKIRTIDQLSTEIVKQLERK